MADLTGRNRWTMAGLFLGVGLVSWLAAMGASRIGGGYLALPGDASVVSLTGAGSGERAASSGASSNKSSRSRARKTPSKRTYVDPITRRNIFDSENVGIEAVDKGEVGDSDRKSDLKVVLLATLVAEPDEFSSALIAEEKSSVGAAGYGVGDDLLGEATIVRIEARRVILRRSDGTVEYIAMEDGATFQKIEDDGDATEKDEDGVEKAGDNKFVIDQETVDKILENPEKLYAQIRAVPHKGTDGEVDGYRLSGIRRKSFFNKLGIKNGDIVHAVNGSSLTSMSAAMDAYNSLQDDKNFNFEITRRNNRQTFEYEIR